MNLKLNRLTLITGAAFAAATIAACGGGGGDSGAPAAAPTQSGTLGVSLTDAPACGFDAVNVTVSKVRVHQNSAAGENDSGWSDITLSPARKINLLNLTNGVLDSLGATSLPAGKYNQLRLVLDANAGAGTANTVVATGSTAEKTLDTPSAVQSGIKIAGQFDVGAGQRTDLVLDFDACKSVVTKGNGKYALKPVIKLIPTVSNGINGFISPALLSSGVSVSAQQNGVIIRSTAPNATTGEFFLSRLAPGSYDVVITADGRAASVVAAVPVATTASTTSLSTVAAPLVLATSPSGSIAGTVTMTPASATGEAAYVSARQTFAAGPTVVVKYAGADLATGAYTINKLPVAAPQYATYSATLPLTFAASIAVTPGVGKYSVSASATGYASQTKVDAVDISTQNASNVNFALAP
ncbi:DUF4382 domain-containing protein [Massilia sp. RP-1-19]|uniref:DUF4382 domain-containing protein n=1 Tax=Massilia polaris TaxID=2728846 RepID=A0A848HRY2_9BURK|nr:DUF4382 domain-containing protein [Massilia polaris]NML62501.1 DUF4382 domain-containing protein [Massilia polaris]